MRNFFWTCLMVVCYVPWGTSQFLDVKNRTIETLDICSESTFSYEVKNVSVHVLDGVEVTFLCPTGIFYVPSSISGGQEVDISNLQAPIFSMDWMPGETKLFSLVLETHCAIYDRVQRGDDFQNMIRFEDPLFVEEYIDDPPFAVQTALLVIVPIQNNEYVSGVSSQRTLAIKNTRNGRVDGMRMEHRHDPLEIASAQGTLIFKDQENLIIELDSNDFKTIGNGDGYFDNNEEWTYVETLIHEKCEQEILASEYIVFWGCDGAYCQSDTFDSDMIFKPSHDRSRLRVTPMPQYPSCPCLPVRQCLLVKNTGRGITDSLRVSFSYGDSTDMIRGIQEGSFFINSGAVQIDSVVCANPKDIPCNGWVNSHECTVYFGPVLAGESFEVCFFTQSCAQETFVGNNEDCIFWTYQYEHTTVCIPDDWQRSAILQTDTCVGLPELGFDWELAKDTGQSSVASIVPGEVYDAVWTAHGQELLDSGLLYMSFCVPCGIHEAGPLTVSNAAVPSSTFDEVDSTGKVYKTFVFELPFSTNSVEVRLPLSFTCEDSCVVALGRSSFKQYKTSCPNVQSQSCKMVMAVEGYTKYVPCPHTSSCGYVNIGGNGGYVECEWEFQRDTIPAYIDFASDAYRLNYGEKDEDDDRRKDGQGVDTTIAKRRRVTYSDTLEYTYSGSIVVDQPGRFDSLEFILSPGIGLFEYLGGYFAFKDFETGETFECDMNRIELLPGVSCVPSCLLKVCCGQEGGLVAKISEHTLAEEGCPFPDFHVTEGDSVFFKYQITNLVHQTSSGSFTSLQRAAVYDRQSPSDFYSCVNSAHIWQRNNMVIRMGVQGDFQFDPCGSTTQSGGFVLDMHEMNDNFFSSEYRQQVAMRNLRFLLPDGVLLDSVQMIVVYNQQGGKDTVFNEFHVAGKEVDGYRLADSIIGRYRMDEGFELYFLPFLRIDDCRDRMEEDEMVILMDIIGLKGFKFAHFLNERWPVDSFTFAATLPIQLDAVEIDVESGNEVVYAYDSTFCVEYILDFSRALDSFYIVSHTFNNPNLEGRVMVDPSVETTGLGSGRYVIQVPEAGKYNIQVCHSNESCENDSLGVHLFWTCGGVDAQERCFEEAFIYEIRKVDAELEMDLISKEEVLSICDTSDWIEIDLYSADLGTAHNVVVHLMRHSGIEILPGSLMYQYPYGDPWQAAPFSTTFNGLTLDWDLDLIEGLHGLMGIQSAPYHRVKIRFKLLTDCQYSSGGSLSVLLSGEGPCGESTNSVRKNTEPIHIQGAPQPFVQELNGSVQFEECMDEAIVRVTLLSASATSGEEVVDLILPNGALLDVVDFVPVKNISQQVPTQVTHGSLQVWRWKADAIASGDSLVFEFKIIGLTAYLCSELSFQIESKSTFFQFCKTAGEECETAVVHGGQNFVLSIPGYEPHFNIDSLTLDGDVNKLYFHLGSSFSHDTLSRKVGWKMYKDEDADGRKGVSEEIIVGQGSQSVPSETQIVVDWPDDGTCYFVIVTNGDCACAQDTLSFEIDRLIMTSVADTICAGSQLVIGTGGSKVLWTGDGVQCDTCPFQTIVGDPDLDSMVTVHVDEYIFHPQDCNENVHYSIVIMPEQGGSKEVISLCEGEQVQLHSEMGPVLWTGPGIDTHASSIVVMPDTTASYLLSGQGDGCGRVDTICVQVWPHPVILEQSNDTTIYAGDEADLHVVSTSSQLKWTPVHSLDCGDCPEVKASPDTTTTYQITVTDSNGCHTVTTITVFVLARPCDDRTIFIPNAFSPNGDNVNDVWLVHSNYINDFYAVVYDRWGEKVFESLDIRRGWDGSFNGAQLTPDVYAYYIRVTCQGGETFFDKGNLTLFH